MNIDPSILISDAIFRNDLEAVKSLVKDENVNAIVDSDWSRTALHLACDNNSDTSAIIHYLLSIPGIDVSVTDDNGDTPFHIACAENKVEFVKLWANPDTINTINGSDDGKTPLHIACDSNDPYETITHLLTIPGINVNAGDSEGETPLHIVCQNPDTLQFVKLWATPENINTTGGDLDRTPLHYACDSSSDTCQIINHLLTIPGINVNIPDSEGATPLHLVSEDPHKIAFVKLWATPENINTTGGDLDRTPLHYACNSSLDTSDIINHLLTIPGINVDITDSDGTSPLHLVCEDPHKIAFVKLWANPENINTIDADSHRTPLHFACDTHDTTSDIINHLLTIPGIETNLADKDGETPLSLVCQYPEKLEFVKKWATDDNINNTNPDTLRTPLHIACDTHSNTLEIIHHLTSFPNIDTTLADTDGETPLHIVCQYPNKLELVKLWVTPENINTPSLTDSKTPLHFACDIGYDTSKIIHFLLTVPGITVNIPDSYGDTPLHLVCQHPEKLEFVKLWANPENINTVNQSQAQTPLHLACDTPGNLKTIQHLLTIPGIDINILDEDGETPMQIAATTPEYIPFINEWINSI